MLSMFVVAIKRSCYQVDGTVQAASCRRSQCMFHICGSIHLTVDIAMFPNRRRLWEAICATPMLR